MNYSERDLLIELAVAVFWRAIFPIFIVMIP